MMSLRPWDPPVVGGYKLTHILGTGGQGVVYLGEDSGGAQVAVKVLHPHLAGDSTARDRFMREVEVARKAFEFTARVLDVGTFQDTLYIVSEYIDGKTLADLVEREGPRQDGALLRTASGMAIALASIHASGVIHCDLKPENIMFGPDGLRVVDFGISRALDTVGSKTSKLIGTPAYMAPEQITGGPLGTHTDIFAWGATVVFAATGMPPFGRAGERQGHALMYRILHDEPNLSDVPEGIAESVAWALKKEPGLRPTATELILRLLRQQGPSLVTQGTTSPDEPEKITAVETQKITSTDESHKQSPTRPFIQLSGHRGKVTCVTLAEHEKRLIALSGGADGVGHVWDVESGKHIRQHLEATNAITSIAFGADEDRNPVLFSGSLNHMVRVSDFVESPGVWWPHWEHGAPVYSVALGELGGLSWQPIALSGGFSSRVPIWDLRSRNILGHLRGHSGAVGAVALGCVNGIGLALTASDDHTARVWDLKSQKEISRIDGLQMTTYSVAIDDATGQMAAIGAGNNYVVHAWDLETGQEVSQFEGHSGWIHSASIGWVGSRAVAVTAGWSGGVRLWDIRTGRELEHINVGATSVGLKEFNGEPYVAVGGVGGSISLWRLQSSRW